MRSQTILPMPQGMSRLYESYNKLEESDGHQNVDLVLKASLENTVTKWSNVINDILKQQSIIAFDGGVNPTPFREVEFWNSRLKNLEFIFDQLRDPRVKMLAKFLEKTKSVHFNTFKNMFKNVVSGVVEARDICLYLKPLIPHFERFESVELFDNETYVKPLVHVLGLLWANSKYYCTNEKIIILLREIANMLIDASNRQLDPSSIFQGEADEMYEKISKVLDILINFIDSFEYVRKSLSFYFKGEEENMPPLWTFHQQNVFQRLLDYIQRLKLINVILTTNLEFSKLEKVEFGGIKGRLLSQKCNQIFEEFGVAYNVFNNIQYDPCDIADDSIVKDNDTFRTKYDDFDKRLATIFSQAFDDCYNLESSLKFISIIGNLLERPVIRAEITPKYSKILDIFNNELDTVKVIYDDEVRHGITIDKNYSPVAGTLLWLYKLRQRIEKSGIDIQNIEDDIVETEKAQYVFDKYEHMMRILIEHQNRIFKAWCTSVPEQIENNLAKFEVVRNESGLLDLNFDQELVAALREIRYLNFLEMKNIPQVALDLFDKVEQLFDCTQKFNRIVEWYNHLKKHSLDVEYNLIESEMIALDELLETVISKITWNNHDDNNLITIYEKIKNLFERVKQCQQNLSDIVGSLNSWVKVPLFERRDGKKENLLYIEDRNDRASKRYDQIAKCNEKINILLKENYRLFLDNPEKIEEKLVPAKESLLPQSDKLSNKDDSEKQSIPHKKKVKAKKEKSKNLKPSKKDKLLELTDAIQFVEATTPKDYSKEHWSQYLTYIDDLVKTKLLEGIYFSLTYFLNESGDVSPVQPLFELLLELHDPDIVFNPTIDSQDEYNFIDQITKHIDDIFIMGEKMLKVNPEIENENYFIEVRTDNPCIKLAEELKSRMMLMKEDAYNFVKEFDEFVPIWIDDRQEYLRQFLQYGRLLNPEEIDKADEIKLTPPTVAQFKKQIDFYEILYKKVALIPGEKILDGNWMRIDVRPLRQAILNTIRKWGNLFKQHLYDLVITSLNELENFIKEAISSMQVVLQPDNYDGLLKVMGYLFKVKERQLQTDNMFQPLKEIIDLLADYGMDFPEEINVQLQEIPDRWQHCKKVAALTKQNVAPLQALQVNAIKRRINLFEIRQQMYRDQFKKQTFFKWSCKNIYRLLDKTNSELYDLEKEMTKLQEQANLFELTLPELKQMALCRKEIKQIKQLWDYVNIFRSCINEWKKTPWKKIDVEVMEMECKKYGKEVRAMDKELRAWDVYIQLEAAIKNMLTSLRAVTELQNPAIRDRHWKQLMQATKVLFNLINKICL